MKKPNAVSARYLLFFVIFASQQFVAEILAKLVQRSGYVNDFSEPEPDIAILRPRDDFYALAHPKATDVFLVIEIADTSVEYDHDIKLPAYARSAVPEVWIVDLPAETVAVNAELVNGVYRAVRSYRRSDSITPRHFSDLSVEVVSTSVSRHKIVRNVAFLGARRNFPTFSLGFSRKSNHG